MSSEHQGVVGPDTTQSRALGHPLRLRSDQVFTEVRATLATSFLDLIQHNRHALFERLHNETGVLFENKENSDCTLRGHLEQILLAKLKLETYLLDFQDVLLQVQSPLGDVDTTNHPLPHQLTTSGLAAQKIKVECEDEDDSPPRVPTYFGLSKKTKLSPVDEPLANHHSPILASLIGLKSRRKVGRPRRIDNLFGAPDDSMGLLSELNSNGKRLSAANMASAELNDYSSDVDLSSTNGEGSGAVDDNRRPSRPHTGANGRTILEEEAERKAAEWLSIGLDPSQLMDTSAEDDKDKSESQFEYSCELCSFKATREGQFLKHVLIHGKQDTVHKCDKCNFASVSLNHVNRHRLTHSDSVFKCPQCNFLTDDAKQLARHVTLKHTMIADSLPKGSGMLQCNDCAYQTTKIYHFERHLLVHNRDLKGLLQVYHCDQCPYRTHRKEHFLRHRDNVHLRNRPYQCGSCSRGYKREDALQQHQITVHGIYPPDGPASLMDLSLAGTSDDVGSLADTLDLLSAVPSATTTSSGASISIIPSVVGNRSGKCRTSFRSTAGSGGIPSLIAGALKANHGDTAMPRTTDQGASPKWGSALSTLVSSVSITPAVPNTTANERTSTVEKVSISISPLANFRAQSPAILSSP